ncbi:MAG: DNA repair exonuclease [Candidatus Caldarchaeum sp.]
MLLAHLADIHLGYRQYGLLEREEDVYHAFGEAVDKIIQEHAEAVLVAGDFFHSPRPPIRALYHAKQDIEKLKTRKIKTYFILGDHDMPRRLGEWNPTALFADDYFLHLKNRAVQVELGGKSVVLAGIDKQPTQMVDEARETLAKLSNEVKQHRAKAVLMAHVQIRGGADELTANDLPQNFDYYALGHEHVRKIFR